MKPAGQPETFGEKVGRLREERSLSRYALAKMTGITQAGLAKVEGDESQPTWDTVQKIALALGVDCTTFVDSNLELPTPRPPVKLGRPRKPETPPAPPAEKPAKKGRKKGGTP
jgi:transcriptional regulator with XRE-family HTH domain